MSDMAANKAIRIPSLVYGTAWKKEKTRGLVHQAIKAGFKGIDTAAQPKHYQEDLVGEGIRDAIQAGILKREDLHIQTKYTSIGGQDPARMPYNPKLSIKDQVAASVASSLRNLRHTEDGKDSYIDCLILHSPLPNFTQTQEAWQAMESFVGGQVRSLGISNIYHHEELRRLYQASNIAPSVVQNRFYPETGYDRSIRQFCREKGIVYQSFWTLTANPKLLRSKPVGKVAEDAGVNKEVALYSLVLGLGEHMSVLDGTTNAGRMEEDVNGVKKAQEWAKKSAEVWDQQLKAFQSLIGEIG